MAGSSGVGVPAARWQLHCRLARSMAANEVYVSDWQQVSHYPLDPAATVFPLVFQGGHIRGHVFYTAPGGGAFYVQGSDISTGALLSFESPPGTASAGPNPINTMFSVRLFTQWVRIRYVNGAVACYTDITAWITED